MTIFRGEGGGGDATTDSEINFITSLTNSIVADTALTTANAAASAASALAAATSESNAAASEIAAASSASAASASAISADASANSAANSYDSFDDRYLGSKTVAPTLDNDGNALLVGALYWNSVTTKLFVWSGTAWRDGFFSGLSSSLVTATAGQTVVTTPSYTQNTNTIQVYVNGLKVISGTDFTETSSTSITFSSGLTLGDEVEIVIVQSVSIGTTLASNVSYTPTGTIAAANVQDALSELSSEKVQSTVLASTGGAALVGNTPSGTIAATTVQGAINEIVSDLTASTGSSLVGYLPSGTGAVTTTVQTKLREFPSVSDYSTFLDYTNAAVTSNWYVEYGGKVQRFTDRVFMGDAAKNNGRNEAIQADWLTTFQRSTGRSFGFLQIAQGGLLQGASTDASNAFVVGAQTATLYDNYNAVGLVGVAVSNKTSGTGYAYGAYLEAYRMPSTTGGAYGIEVDTANYAALTGIDPYFQDAGQIIGIQIASGAELSPVGQFDSTAAINIQNNGTKFFKGLVFGRDALTGSDGVTGLAEAITLAKGHTIQWWGSQGVTTSSIYCEGTTTAGGIDMRFSENQLQLRAGGGGKIVYQMFAPTGSVNYISNRASVTGSAVQILAQGDDTNIDLQLLPKGSGTLLFGTYTAGTFSQTGYITVKDSGGTVRRLMVG